MQDRPDVQDIMAAVIAFLHAQARDGGHDDDLRRRLIVATDLLRMVKAELMTEQAFTFRERSGLSRLLPEHETRVRFEGGDADREAIGGLNAVLHERILSGRVGQAEMDEILSHLMGSLERKLAVVSPRFDTSSDVP